MIHLFAMPPSAQRATNPACQPTCRTPFRQAPHRLPHPTHSRRRKCRSSNAGGLWPPGASRHTPMEAPTSLRVSAPDAGVTTPREPLNESRSPSAPLFAGGDGVAVMGRQPAARRGLRSPRAAGRPSGGPKGRAACVAAPCVGPATRLRRALPSRHLSSSELPGLVQRFPSVPSRKQVGFVAGPFRLPARRDDALWRAPHKEEQRGRGPKGPRIIKLTCGTAH